jgi:hypothetical protein
MSIARRIKGLRLRCARDEIVEEGQVTVTLPKDFIRELLQQKKAVRAAEDAE